MPLTVLLGGAGSGKSRLAAAIASSVGGPVTVVATGEARDDEMTQRIARHRDARPPEWSVIEEPCDLHGALSRVRRSEVAIVDCLTLWVSNLMERDHTDEEIETAAVEAAEFAAERPGHTVVVTNEVGSGVVPVNELARRYRDTLARVNAIWTDRADRAALVVAGRVTELRQSVAVFPELADG